MNKKPLFFSIALTAFVLVILAGVVATYRTDKGVAQAAENTAAPTEIVATEAPTATAPAVFTHQDAAQVASQYLGQTDVYSVEVAQWNGVSAYKTVFSSGQVVYVSMDGKVLAVEQPTPVVVQQPAPVKQPRQPSQNTASSGGGEHKDHEDKEEHEEHD